MRAPFLRAFGPVAAAVSAARAYSYAGDTPATTVLHSQGALVWFSYGLVFPHTDGMMPVHVRFRQNDFDLTHCNHWQKANEKEEEGEENSVGAEKGPDADPGRNEQAPGAGQEITMQSADDDDETLEP